MIDTPYYQSLQQKVLLEVPSFSPHPKHVLSSEDLSPEDIRLILDTAKFLKKQRKRNPHLVAPIANRMLAMIFEKQSLRTRVSFETGFHELGGHACYLTKSDIEMGKRESIADTARVLSNWATMIVARLYKQSDLEELAQWSKVPVINGLTDQEHPCQALADMLTIEEFFGTAKLKIAWIGDGNNVCNSLAVTAAKLGHEVVVCTPIGYEAAPHVYGYSNVSQEIDPEKAASEAHVISTDVWVSMGQEEETAIRTAAFSSFQVNEKLLELAHPEAIFLHCLPAVRGLEVTDGVIDGAQSAVFHQSDNRLHAQKALMSLLLDGVLA